MYCENCWNWERAGLKTGTGTCRIRAPHPEHGWPATTATDYCGEFVGEDGKVTHVITSDRWLLAVYDDSNRQDSPTELLRVIAFQRRIDPELGEFYEPVVHRHNAQLGRPDILPASRVLAESGGYVLLEADEDVPEHASSALEAHQA